MMKINTTKNNTMKENIKKLYKQLIDKKGFNTVVAKEFGNQPQSVATNWFSNYWAIPEEYRPRVVEMLQNAILNQNKKASA
jgi:hypothetical protein